jgi:hypothetical protein
MPMMDTRFSELERVRTYKKKAAWHIPNVHDTVEVRDSMFVFSEVRVFIQPKKSVAVSGIVRTL